MNSVYQTFSQTADAYPQHDFLHIPANACTAYSATAITFSYAEFHRKVQLLIEEYRAANTHVPGSRIALLLDNRPEFFLHFFALNALGISVVPINGEMRPEEQAYLLEHSEVSVLICLPEYLDSIQPAVNLCTSALRVLASDQLHLLSDQCSSTVADKSAMHSETAPAITSSTECALLYTSGSTGKPKGCVLSNDYFLTFGRWYRDIGGYCRLEAGVERLLTPLPLVHMNAMAVSTMGMIMTGGCIIQLDRFHPSTWWQNVVESGATAMHYLGVLPAILLALEVSDVETQHKVKFGFGAGVNPRHQQRFEARFGFPLVESWAMSESGAGGCVTANQDPRHVGKCCFGKPGATVEILLVDEKDQPVASGEPGELLVRAKGEDPRKGFFSGYLKNAQATEAGWKDGWWHTGDVVREGEDGSLFFVDRRKNVIRRSGENIAALEVEAALAGDPLIAQCVVCAVPDEMRGDEVMALLVAVPGADLDEHDARAIFDRASDRLSYFKLPGYIAVVEALPLTASQKPRRADIKLLGKQLLQENACFDLRHLKKRSSKLQQQHL